MARKLIWDLVGVLMTTVRNPKVHPQARELLERSRADFDETWLWTLDDIRDVIKALNAFELMQYFDALIGRSHVLMSETLYRLEDGRIISSKPLSYDGNRKNLDILPGSVIDYVLIDDCGEFGMPKDRVIIVPGFVGNLEHNLELYYLWFVAISALQ